LEEIETQPDAKGLEGAFQTAKQTQVGAIMTTPVGAFSPKESGSLNSLAKVSSLQSTHRGNLWMTVA
jgi:hypothetical protein